MVARGVWNALMGVAERSWALRQAGSAATGSGSAATKAKLESLRGLGVTKPHIWRARAGFSDLDLNMHVNNASFVYCAELARWHLSGLNGLLGVAMKNKYAFLVGGQAFRYRRAIPPFAKYQVRLLAA